MRQYHSDNRNYNAILDAMAQIRQNQLNESYGYYAEEDDEEHMQEAMHGDEDEMNEAEHEEMEEMSDDEAEMVAEMLDEALAEIYEEDDEDNHQIDEADGGERKKRRRNNLLKAAAIGAGLVALGGAGAAGMGLLPGGMGQQAVTGALSAAGRGIGRAGQFVSTQANRAARAADNYAQRGAVSRGAIDDFSPPSGKLPAIAQRRAIAKGAIDDFSAPSGRMSPVAQQRAVRKGAVDDFNMAADVPGQFMRRRAR